MANMRTVTKTVEIEYGNWIEEPRAAARVWWLIDGDWVHKGWLMSTVVPCGDGYKYGGA